MRRVIAFRLYHYREMSLVIPEGVSRTATQRTDTKQKGSILEAGGKQNSTDAVAVGYPHSGCCRTGSTRNEKEAVLATGKVSLAGSTEPDTTTACIAAFRRYGSNRFDMRSNVSVQDTCVMIGRSNSVFGAVNRI